MIPFCDFGGNMSAMGVMIDQFDIPVCNSFQAKIRNDQLCYEVDLNRFSDKNSKDKELKLGFNFILDYNEDRQITFDKNSDMLITENAGDVIELDQNKNAVIYLDTIGKRFTHI